MSEVMVYDAMHATTSGRSAGSAWVSSMEKTIGQKFVTYDFERGMQGATKVKTSEFATRMIENM